MFYEQKQNVVGWGSCKRSIQTKCTKQWSIVDERKREIEKEREKEIGKVTEEGEALLRMFIL